MNTRWNFFIRLTPLIPFFLFVLSFRQEIGDAIRWIQADNVPVMPDTIAHSINVLWTNITFFGLFFLAWLLIISAQSILPVVRVKEWLLTAVYLLFHMFGLHGMAGYVRNGRIKAYVDELQRSLPGAIAVDFNSALVVEQTVLPNGFLRLLTFLCRVLAWPFVGRLPTVRVCGAGLVFTFPDERIHGVNDLEDHPVGEGEDNWMDRILGVVDLRTQFRISGRQPHKLSKRLRTTVSAYTRDGIELQTNIWILATIGQEPAPYFPLNVTYVGDRHPRNLRIVSFKKVSGRAHLYRVQSIRNDLDPRDQLEIHAQMQAITDWEPYQDSPRHPTLPVFNAERIFPAIYARARHHLGLRHADEIVPWVDLPVHVAIEVFRELVSQYNYDELYRADADGNLRVNGLRSRLAAEMRNRGLLSYRPVQRVDGRCLELRSLYHAARLQSIDPLQAFVLKRSDVLRDRGIRIIASGFGDLFVHEKVYRQRLDHWRANWDREADVLEAGYDVEVARTRTRARIQAQQDFVQSLSEIYRSNGNSKEILALRVLQALEEVAADPKTRELLPEDTFSLLRSVHDWILPQDIGIATGSQEGL